MATGNDVNGNVNVNVNVNVNSLQTPQVHRAGDGPLPCHREQGDSQEGTQRVHGKGHDSVMSLFDLNLLCLLGNVVNLNFNLVTSHHVE